MASNGNAIVLEIVKVVVNDYAKRNGLVFSEAATLTRDTIIGHLDSMQYIALNAKSDEIADVVVLIIKQSPCTYTSAPEFRKLVKKFASATKRIVIADDTICKSSFVQNAVADESNCFLYPYRRFITVVPDYSLVPNHRIMSKDEVATLLAETSRTFEDFPRILVTDPAIIWIGGKRGDMIEITRISETAGVAFYYRRVL